MPFFSIIIPVYNVAQYLRECLDSVLAQTFTDWEAICIDDGSTDESGVILDKYKLKDGRFRVVHQSNQGVGASRNVGLDSARGDWVLFLDSDDVWSTELLSTIRKMICLYPKERLFRFSFEIFNNENNLTVAKDYSDEYEIADISNEIAISDFCDYPFWCFAYSASILSCVRFPTYSRGEDRYVLNRLMLEKVNSYVASGQKLYGYRRRSGSAINSAPSLQALCDEMDYRLDIMEMIDASNKKVLYAGNPWFEGFFTTGLPVRLLDCKSEVECVKDAWRQRLPRLLCMKGLSRRGRIMFKVASNRLLRPIGEFLVFMLPYLRYRSRFVKAVAHICRQIKRARNLV